MRVVAEAANNDNPVHKNSWKPFAAVAADEVVAVAAVLRAS
jgi:hypothetical protein